MRGNVLAVTGEQVAARCKHGEMPPVGNIIAGGRSSSIGSSAILHVLSRQTERKREEETRRFPLPGEKGKPRSRGMCGVKARRAKAGCALVNDRRGQ